MGFTKCIAFLSLCSLAACQSSSSPPQPYQSLPPPPPYADGGFSNPNTLKSGYIFTKGSTMNVSWTTTYPTVNLFLIFGQDYGQPYDIASGISQDWHLWTVTDHGDNSHPFSFRATNPHGSQYDQLNGGFFTGQFWVKIPEGSETSSSAMPSASSASRTSMSATSTQTTARKTSSSAIATGSASQNDSSNSTTVGVGAGVGVGGGVVLIAAGGFLWWLIRRRRQSKNPPPGQISPGDMRSTAGWSHGDSSTLWSQNGQPYYAPMGQTDPFYGGPQPGFNPWQPSELGPGQPLVEAPSNVEPKELAADGLKPKELAADGSNDRRKPPGEWD